MSIYGQHATFQRPYFSKYAIMRVAMIHGMDTSMMKLQNF